MARGISPLKTSPNSPAAKDREEQKPSEDDIIKVRPSLDLVDLLAGAGVPGELYIPCKIGKGSAVEIAHDADRGLLLSIIQQYRVLSSYRIYHAIWQ